MASTPDHKRDELRAFIEHERSLDHDVRADALEALKKKGKDPHDLMHRYEHHLENNDGKS